MRQVIRREHDKIIPVILLTHGTKQWVSCWKCTVRNPCLVTVLLSEGGVITENDSHVL